MTTGKGIKRRKLCNMLRGMLHGIRLHAIVSGSSALGLHSGSRKPAFVRQTFAICIGHPAEIISLQKMSGRLLEKGSMQAIAHYLNLLEEAGLIAAVAKYPDKPIRVRSSPPKRESRRYRGRNIYWMQLPDKNLFFRADVIGAKSLFQDFFMGYI